MTGKQFKQKLRSGDKLFGTCLTQPSPLWSNIIRDIKLDFVFIDNEHWPFSRNEIANLCQIYTNAGIIPTVRIPRPDPFLACIVVDSGALGVVAPYVETIKQVQELVGAVKYSPLKGKNLENGLEKNQWHENTKSFLEKKNENRFVLINIESVPALENLSNLAKVPGLDGLLIGPYDMVLNMGIPNQYDHPKFLKAVKKVVQVAKENGLGAGIHAWWGIEQEKELLDLGLNLLIHSSDYFAAMTMLKGDFDYLKCENVK
ncbi:aldolase [candidate division KSB1 bacterium]|nr:aldolase [candidate division KSB1 bacterium]